MGTAEVRNVELAYDLLGEGEGPPFIWGHGLTSSRDDEDRFPIVDTRRLATGRRVLRYDAAGHGNSSPLPSPERGSWAELALDQTELINQLAFDEVVIGGASMGTGTALHTAAAIGDRLVAQVLVIPPTGWESRAAQIDMYEQMASIVDAKGVEPLIKASAQLAPPDPFVASTEYRHNAAARLRAADRKRLAGNFRGAGHAQLPEPEVVAQIAAPTLVLAWTGDPGHPVSTAQRLGELLPRCEVVLASTAEDLSTWTDRVASFLDQV